MGMVVGGTVVVGVVGMLVVLEGAEEVPVLPRFRRIVDIQNTQQASNAIMTNVQISLVVIERISALLSWK